MEMAIVADKIASSLLDDLKHKRLEKIGMNEILKAVYSEMDKQIAELTLKAYDSEDLVNLVLRKVCNA